MDRTYSTEMQQRAEDLYLLGGMNLVQVSRATGVAYEVLTRWAERDHWAERKSEERKARDEIRRNMLILRRRLLEKAVESLDNRDIQTLAKLESVAGKTQAREETPLPEECEAEGRSYASPEEAVDALQETIDKKIAILAARPEALSASAIRDMKRALELMEGLKATYAKKDAEKAASKPKGLSTEMAEEIRRKILGIR